MYETVIEDLCLNNGIKPKIIASTATIKNSVDQIKWIFARTISKIFPPQALDFGDTYFSEVIPSSKQRGRIHVGLCSTSAGGQTADARIAGAILRKIRYILENKNNEFNYTADEIDPYYTLISYYNTRRSAGSALRYYGDSVPYFMGTISSKFETDGAKNKNPLQVAELTGRLDASEIPEIFKQIEVGMSKEMSVKLVRQTLLGSIELAIGSEFEPTKLKEMVTSPGGTTEAALSKFEEGGFSDLVSEAVYAAFERAKFLGGK